MGIAKLGNPRDLGLSEMRLRTWIEEDWEIDKKQVHDLVGKSARGKPLREVENLEN